MKILDIKRSANIDLSGVGVDLAEQLVRADFAKSKSEARRFIKDGAVRLNDTKVTDPFARLTADETGDFVLVQTIDF